MEMFAIVGFQIMYLTYEYDIKRKINKNSNTFCRN